MQSFKDTLQTRKKNFFLVEIEKINFFLKEEYLPLINYAQVVM